MGIWVVSSVWLLQTKLLYKVCTDCYREEPILTPYWICFFDFNLCFPLLLVTKRILSIYNSLSQGAVPSAVGMKKPSTHFLASPLRVIRLSETFII